MSSRVLVTGANGFIGSHLCLRLAAHGFEVRAAVRSPEATPAGAVETIAVGDINSHTDWSAALQGIGYVVHAAARVHELDRGQAGAALGMETNAAGTRRLAVASVRADVRRFVLLSTVKVNGEETTARPFTAADTPEPQGTYGISKREAERFVAQACASSATRFAVIRAPLVYGPRVRANFLRLMRWIERGYPLPFGAIANRRSLVSVWNLADLVATTLHKAEAVDRTWMVSDGEDLSTAQLAVKLARAMGRRARIFAVPERLLRLGASLAGRRADVARLCGSLQVDIGATTAELGWAPTLDVDTGLARTAHWYLAKSG